MRRFSGLPGIRVGLVVILTIASLSAFIPETASASTILQQAILRLDDVQTGIHTTGSVCFQPKTTANLTQIVIAFPSTFTLSSTSGNWTISTTPPGSPPSGQNYWPGTVATWPAGAGTPAFGSVAGTTVTLTWTAASFSNASLYCFRWTNVLAITSTGAAGQDETGTITTQSAGPTTVDTDGYAVTILATGGDQVGINASVPPIFEFSLDTNTVTFSGPLDHTIVNISSTVKATATTNAKGGWIMWAESLNGGLSSASSGGFIPTVTWNTDLPTALAPNVTAQDALSVVTTPAATTYCSTSNLSVDPEYDTAGHGGTDGGMFTSTFAEIGKCTGNVSDGDALTMAVHAAITAVTPAATDYTDTMTVVGAGNF